jgi:hypothetical protein
MTDCVHCERLSAIALSACRTYHLLRAELECAYIIHDEGAPLLVGKDIDKAEHDRAVAVANLVAHESAHQRQYPTVELSLSKRQSA